MKKIYFLIIIFGFSMSFSCSNNGSNKKKLNIKEKSPLNSTKEYSNFLSRIHKSSYEIDWYKILGTTSLKKHTIDFESINWEKEYWEQWNSKDFNFPDLEVIDQDNYMYLSVSVCPRDSK